MKKTLSTAALSTVLVLGMAASAFATHQTQPAEQAVSTAGASAITIDGAIRQRGLAQKATAAKDSPSQSSYDGRVHLGFKAQADQVTGYVQFETKTGDGDSYTWGQNPTSSKLTDPQPSGSLHKGGYKTPGQMDLLQAWVQYQPSNWGVKVGHQPLALGNKVFFDHTGSGDDAIMAYTTMGDTHLAGILIKFDEQSTTDSTDDLDGYVAMATHKFSDNLDAGINWTYLRGGSNTGDTTTTTTTTVNSGAAPSGYLADGTAVYDPTDITTSTTSTTSYELVNGMSMSNIGVNANYRQDNLSFLADGEFQFGDYSDNGSKTVSANGWALKLGANMDLGAAKVGLLYGYGSGDDNANDDNHDAFVNFLTDTNYDTLIAGYRANVPGTSTKYSGLTNLSEYQINVATKTTCPITGKDLSLKASATYLQLNEEVAARLDKDANGNSMNYLGNDSDVGTELDAIATWSLAPGLIYKVEAGYLFVGDAWNTKNATNGTDPDDLYFLRHRIEYAF